MWRYGFSSFFFLPFFFNSNLLSKYFMPKQFIFSTFRDSHLQYISNCSGSFHFVFNSGNLEQRLCGLRGNLTWSSWQGFSSFWCSGAECWSIWRFEMVNFQSSMQSEQSFFFFHPNFWNRASILGTKLVMLLCIYKDLDRLSCYAVVCPLPISIPGNTDTEAKS